MIKLELNNKLKQRIEKKHIKTYYEKCYKQLQKLINEVEIEKYDAFINDNEKKNFYKFLQDRLREILIGEPKVLEEVCDYIKNNFSVIQNTIGKTVKKGEDGFIIKKKIKAIFDYNSFILNYPDKEDPERWGAYALTEETGLKVCPYCNRQYIVTYHPKNSRVKNKGITRPVLDHFLDKKSYPYLAISLYNLIPCCKVCNSDLKGQNEFSVKNNINPYIEGFDKDIRFEVICHDADGLVELYSKRNDKITKSDFNIKFNIANKGNSKLTQKEERAKNNIETFRLEELYSFHKDIVIDMLKTYWLYNEYSINAIVNCKGVNLFDNKTDIIEFIYSIYRESSYSKKAFAKFTNDVAESLGIYDVIKNLNYI